MGTNIKFLHRKNKTQLPHQFPGRNSLSAFHFFLPEIQQCTQPGLLSDHLLLSNHFQYSPGLAWLNHREELVPRFTQIHNIITTYLCTQNNFFKNLIWTCIHKMVTMILGSVLNLYYLHCPWGNLKGSLIPSCFSLKTNLDQKIHNILLFFQGFTILFYRPKLQCFSLNS